MSSRGRGIATLDAAPPGTTDCKSCGQWLASPGAAGKGPGTLDDALGRLAADPRFASRYALRGMLGRGGMAVVALARQQSTGRDVAVKLLSGGWSPEGAERFLREGRLLAELTHPNILKIFDLGMTGALPYMVIELGSQSLRDVMDAQGEMPLARVVEIAEPCLRALALCHARGVIHRDLKPDNVLFGADGLPRLADFGLALPSSAENLTVTGAFVGTARYTAPELISGARPSPASDMFAFGVMLYEMFAGRPPFWSEHVSELFRLITLEDPPHLADARPELPLPVIEALNFLLVKRPERRTSDAAALADAMRGWASLPPRRRRGGPEATLKLPVGTRPRRPARAGWFAAMAALAGIAVALVVAWRAPRRAEPPVASALAQPVLALDADAVRALAVAVEQADRSCDRALQHWASLLAMRAIPGNWDESRRYATKLIARTQGERHEIVESLAPLRKARREGRGVDVAVHVLLVRGVSCDHFGWWVIESGRRLLAGLDDERDTGRLDAPRARAAEAEGVALTREFQDELLELLPRLQPGPTLHGHDVAELLDDDHAVARSLQFFEWSEVSRAQLARLSEALLARLARLPGPIAPAVSGCWTWGNTGGAKKVDRAALAAAAARVRALVPMVRKGAGDLERIASEIQRDARL